MYHRTVGCYLLYDCIVLLPLKTRQLYYRRRRTEFIYMWCSVYRRCSTRTWSVAAIGAIFWILTTMRSIISI